MIDEYTCYCRNPKCKTEGFQPGHGWRRYRSSRKCPGCGKTGSLSESAGRVISSIRKDLIRSIEASDSRQATKAQPNKEKDSG